MYVDFGIYILSVFFLMFPLVFWFALRMRTKGAMNCGIIQKGKPLKFKMLKIKDGDHVDFKDDHWLINDRQVKIVDFPMGFMWDMFPMNFFQMPVPTSLYMVGRGDPLDWEDPSKGSTISSTELKAILDPKWMKTLVAGVVEGGGGLNRMQKMMLFLAVGLGGICMILLFVLLSRGGGG